MLAYSEHGTASGHPVLFFHGTPGSRLFRHPDDSIAASLGARIITIDRPGLGLSDFKPHRRLIDWPNDVIELVETLRIERFAIAGLSGGGPYVVACALKIPDRLTAAGLISSVGPMDVPGATNEMLPYLRLMFRIARSSAALTSVSWRLADATLGRNVERIWILGSRRLPASERALYKDGDIMRMLSRDYEEALRCGFRGIAYDTALLARPWGCHFEDVAPTIFLWHGEEDVRATSAMGRHLARILPDCRPVFYPGEGHDVFYRHWTEILSTLLSPSTSEKIGTQWWHIDRRLDGHQAPVGHGLGLRELLPRT